MKREFDAKLRKVGNSLVVTVPVDIIKQFGLKESQFVTVSIITKIKREFDARLRKVGNSFVVTVPALTIERFGMKENQFVTVLVKLEK